MLSSLFKSLFTSSTSPTVLVIETLEKRELEHGVFSLWAEVSNNGKSDAYLSDLRLLLSYTCHPGGSRGKDGNGLWGFQVQCANREATPISANTKSWICVHVAGDDLELKWEEPANDTYGHIRRNYLELCAKTEEMKSLFDVLESEPGVLFLELSAPDRSSQAWYSLNAG